MLNDKDDSPRHFRNKDKYVVQQHIEGEETYIDKSDEGLECGTRDSVPEGSIVLGKANDIRLEVRDNGDHLYVYDLLRYEGEDMKDKPWSERHSILRTFDWGRQLRIAFPLVVHDQEELKHAIKMYKMLPESSGAIIHDYDDDYPRQPHLFEADISV